MAAGEAEGREMIVYRCDKCGDEGLNEDMRGRVVFIFGLYYAAVTAYIKSDGRWVTPTEDDNYHLCKKCVVEIVRQGDIHPNDSVDLHAE